MKKPSNTNKIVFLLASTKLIISFTHFWVLDFFLINAPSTPKFEEKMELGKGKTAKMCYILQIMGIIFTGGMGKENAPRTSDWICTWFWNTLFKPIKMTITGCTCITVWFSIFQGITTVFLHPLAIFHHHSETAKLRQSFLGRVFFLIVFFTNVKNLDSTHFCLIFLIFWRLMSKPRSCRASPWSVENELPVLHK